MRSFFMFLVAFCVASPASGQTIHPKSHFPVRVAINFSKADEIQARRDARAAYQVALEVRKELAPYKYH